MKEGRAPVRPAALRRGSGDAVLFPGTRGEAAARLDRPGALFVADPLEACGEGHTRLVLPHAKGILRVPSERRRR